jgi:hypothetical protein
MTLTARPALGMRSRCHHDTNDMPAEYASLKSCVNVSHWKSAIT